MLSSAARWPFWPNPAAADSLLVIETLRRIIGAVEWDQLEVTSADAHATLYETFLQEYDPELRRQSGSYYTPDRLARSMVRFTDEILREKLNRPWGYANDDVIVVDPAMGTGTFLVEVVDLVAETVAAHQGEGARAQRLRDLFGRRLIGFEAGHALCRRRDAAARGAEDTLRRRRAATRDAVPGRHFRRSGQARTRVRGHVRGVAAAAQRSEQG